MEFNDDEMVLAWLRAADDLGIAVHVSPAVTVGSVTVRALVLVTNFGYQYGMLIFDRVHYETARPHFDGLVDAGFGYSVLTGGKYDREVFIDILNDWQWNDADRSPPKWYTGPPSDDS